MGKKNTKGTQKVNPIMDASVVSPPYETAFGMSNTEEVKKGKQVKHSDLHSCKCKDKKNNNIHKPTRTWESINKMYGDVDTTEVWDKRKQKPKKFFSSIFHKQENPKKTIDKSEHNDVTIYSTSNLKKIPAKLSHIGLHRKRKTNHNKINKIKTEQYENENNKDTYVQFSPYIDPKVKFMLSKEPKKGLKDQYAIGDICTEGPCREALENLYNLYGLKYTLNQTDKLAKYGNNDKRKNEKKKTKVPTKENKIVRTNCKCKYDDGMTLQTLDNINEDNSKKEKPKTKTLTKEYKVRQSKKKQINANKITKDGNVGYGDQRSTIPSKKQDLNDVQCKCSFIGKMMGRTNCKCKYDTRITLQTSDNVNEDNSKKEKPKTETLTKEMKVIKQSKKKQAKADRITKDGNVGYGDQISPIPLKKQDLKDVQCKCSFIGKMMRHTICKCKTNTESTPINPLLEMKVNLTDMRVINSLEVNENIKKLGKTEKNMSCLCPSRLKRDVCQRGPCEIALENQNTNFVCKCQKQKDIRVECNDSTCDLNNRHIKIKPTQKKIPKSKVYKEGDKPLFEVMIDPAEMSVINANEIKDIIGKAYQNKIICPTGICNKMAKQKNVHLNCKCVGKKLTPYVNECEERTCRDAEKKCKLSYLCSRVFSKSENRTRQEENRKGWPVTDYEHDTHSKRDDFFVRSHRHYKRNGVMINLPRGQALKRGAYVGGKLSDVWCKCFCECNTKVPKKSLKRKSKKKVSKRRRKRKGFFRKKKKDDRTLTEKVLDCLDKEQEECEKRVKVKTKEHYKNEKRAIEENRKMVAKQKKVYKTHQFQMTCLTNFFSGMLNVCFESVKTALHVVFSVILEPIKSYVYVKEKIKDPPAAIMRIIEWFIRTWKNKSSAIAQALSESPALNVIADHIEESAVYNALAPKGRTPAERMMYERRSRGRKRRIQKRNDQALYGCRHILLTTMRKTPCLWFYHICPELYPQCLSLLAFMTNFLHILLYCGAIFCWTPCILVCEMCRACMCCLLCTH